ncbi:MAG: hypothetical protein L3J03_00500 [Desulfobacterales bacterium]|nr:hypothetical protein [Desulfobacterales bacterium]
MALNPGMPPVRRFFGYALLVGLALLVAGPAAAADSLVVNGEQPRYSLGRHLDVLEDPGGELNIAAVSAPGMAHRFRPALKETLNFGFGRGACWVRFKLDHRLAEEKKYVLEVGSPLIDHVDLYLPRADNTFAVKRAGELVPIQEREIRYRNPAFIIPLPPAATQTLYIRYRDKGSVPFSLTLWEPVAFLSTVKNIQLGLGVYYGTALIIAVYYLILFLVVRFPSYIFFAIHVFFFILWQMAYNGLANEYFWPHHPWLTDRALPFLVCATAISALQFTRVFLQTRETVPGLHRFLGWLMTIFVLIMATSIFVDDRRTIVVAAFFATIFAPSVFITSLVCWHRGYRSARYFTIAWFMLLIGTALLGLKSFGALPSNVVTEYGQQLGSVLEIILLALALADQVNMMKKETEAAQIRALEIQEQATEYLEVKVEERTRELQASYRKMEKLSSKLAKYLAPQVYDSIFSGKTDVKLHSQRKLLTVFFSDIKDFTEMTDNMEPEAMTGLLNEYLNEMAEIIHGFGGTIDKFIGDAIMVFFGDPESRGEQADALASVRMAIAMRERMDDLRHKWAAAMALPKPFRIRMGINTGFCTVGNFGSEDRLDYTIIGGQVNLASRLENSAAPDQILVSATTHALVKDEVACEPMGEIRAKGIARPVQTYQLIGLYEKLAGRAEEIREQGTGYSIALNLKQMSAATKKQVAERLRQVLTRL